MENFKPTNTMKIQGRAIISEDEQKEALFELAKGKREILTLAIDAYLKSKNLSPSSIQYRNGQVEAVIGGESLNPTLVAEASPVKKKMASGWKRDHVGLTRFLKEMFRDLKRTGRKRVKIGDLIKEVHDEYPKAKKKMDELRLGGYLRDQRHFKGIKFNSVTGEIQL
jgi:hypothetical protein